MFDCFLMEVWSWSRSKAYLLVNCWSSAGSFTTWPIKPSSDHSVHGGVGGWVVVRFSVSLSKWVGKTNLWVRIGWRGLEECYKFLIQLEQAVPGPKVRFTMFPKQKLRIPRTGNLPHILKWSLLQELLRMWWGNAGVSELSIEGNWEQLCRRCPT